MSYQDEKIRVAIVHHLMKKGGWKIYGYYPEQIDSLTGCCIPASWSGIAEKNGYLFCVNYKEAEEAREIYTYNYAGLILGCPIKEKIKLLNGIVEMKGTIRYLEKKAASAEVCTVAETIPAHMANPINCKWHIEKDRMVIDKGNAISKYSNISLHYNKKELEDIVNCLPGKGKSADITKAKQDLKLIASFEKLIDRIDTICSDMDDGSYYEKTVVTKYRKINIPIEVKQGSIKENQLFILKTDFNYKRKAGYVYRIHEVKPPIRGQRRYYAYKLNPELNKEVEGTPSLRKCWYIVPERFLEWIRQGAISFCELKEEEVPYEVEEAVKREKGYDPQKEKEPITEDFSDVEFSVRKDIHKDTNDRIFMVKIKKTLNREEHLEMVRRMRKIGGNYCPTKKEFMFFRELPECFRKGN